MGTSFTFEANSTALRTARTVTRYLPAIGRILMGALFLFSGLLGLLVSPQPTPGLPEGAIAFSNALMKTGYMSQLISATEAIVGALLLATTVVLAIQVWRHVPVAFEERVPGHDPVAA